LEINRDGRRRTAFELLAYPGIDLARLRAIWPELGGLEAPIASQLEVDARYASYVARQEVDVALLQREESRHIPAEQDFGEISGLSNEIVQKLERHRPATLAHAGRIDGMTPSALLLLLAHIRKLARKPSGRRAG
ncbi:MAG: tRNA uridine-5-carboxymethylaminomethyl(34) synthesis enzyme MnmG, partial [Hyphomicrobium sp.]|nr:tRNA uridine-5-carboxymethylaminomethyl(34) synthesis enzyme MnmG [Hyphomicrobium sp.]